ncbi:hypothetical protein DSM106972_056530 [Dulcicalothrix desertica PCC 7102]|uniref:Uncharacterized protein n=1 Tax=Dulcicalothrix desertica PCC 7102 TaxID=232991 RepID=A0A3S1C986_9CYAN|nr:hypothetical protein [Dulcicalothrix desertica]RUT02733.1 hypothetical protein DSM106972_056530 [Dulcicalothrix desertica PCC 7102]TWH39032.1 hypothetical protein CAL7102_08236 [Dulcicalothrix desertica PCC 7102]
MNDFAKELKEAQERFFLITIDGKDYDIREVNDWDFDGEDYLNSEEFTLYFNDGTNVTFNVDDLDSSDEQMLYQLIDCM